PAGQIISAVDLLLDDLGTGQFVDAALDRRAPVILLIDAPGEGDKAVAELAVALVPAQLVLDFPESAVDLAQFGQEAFDFRRCGDLAPAHRFERGELAADI